MSATSPAAATVVPGYLNHDAAWYLHMVGVMLDGGTIYRDVIDTNPPLIVYLTTPPVWLGRVTGVSDVVVVVSDVESPAMTFASP